ncbi:MAG TPA: carbohydrate binding family 9 domain-containing protein [Acidisarcina sp.]
MRALVFGFTLLLVTPATSVLCARQNTQKEGPPKTVSSSESSQASLPDAYNVPLLTEGLRLSDFASMEPPAGLRDKLTKIGGFIQNTPNDGQLATQQTEVWLGHTTSAFYMVFICHDNHPGAIRGHLARRENILMDDNVSVLFDPFQDRRKGVLFIVNPAGVQADAEWTENQNTDYSYDQVWDSEGRVTKDGWIAMIVIPFRSLRFRPGRPDWGVVFSRNLPRNSEVDYWPRISASVSGVLSQEGTLHGLGDLPGSHHIQLNPYVLGQNERTLLNLDPLDPHFSSRHIEGTAGGEAKAVLRDSIVLDGTINPDFSTVESDQPQFTVNQRFPVYFPELRPFFLENSNYFATPILLVDTRNIIHPEYGARATGKIGRTNLGFFAIDDREPGDGVPVGDPNYKHRAKFAVGRISEDFGKGSSLGLIYTDEEFGGGWSRVGGVDFTARLSEKWTADGEWVESSTKGVDTPGSPSTYAAGPGTRIDFQRQGHAFNLNGTLKDYSTGFQTQVGFIDITNARYSQTHSTYQWYPKHSLIQSFGLEGNNTIAFDHQGNRIFRNSSFDPFLLLRGNTVIAPLAGQNSDTLGPQDGTLLTRNKNFTENFAGVVARGAPFSQLNFNIQAFRSGNVNFNPVAGGVPSLMNQENLQALVTIQPLRQFTADNTYLLDRDHSVADGALVYESQTFRTKLNYQFTRAISARVIVEYDTTLANPLETSLPRTKQVGTEALLTWLPHPGTAIYIGYNNDLQNLDRTLCNRGPNGACDPNNSVVPRSQQYLNDGRQIFIKASYLFRF